MSRDPIDFLRDIEEIEILWQGIRTDVPVLLKRVQEMIAMVEENP